MATIKKPKKIVLDNQLVEDFFFNDVRLIGIASPLESYEFVYLVNQCFNFNFKRNHELMRSRDEIDFAAYDFFDTKKHANHIIYSNRNKTDFYLTELKNVDFIWMIDCQSNLSQLIKDSLEIIPKLKNSPYCFEIKIEQIKEKQLLLY
ncbi:MAG: IPExxxVDY family protein [Chitinophagaceae bacterium]|nr:IPExxxVDY family protein [Chitinophagaceae bacterium]